MEVPKMLSHTEVPALLVRSHIRSGYRPLHKPTHYYISSAFSCHNEVINVWTHFVPFVGLLILYIAPEIMGPQRFPVLVLYAGTAALLAGSTLAHLMHSRSPLDHIFWFLVDFSGIALFAVAIGIQRHACDHQSLDQIVDFVYLPGLMVFALLLQYLTTSYLFVLRPYWPRRLHIRLVTSAAIALWLQVPLAHRYWKFFQNGDWSEPMTLHSRAFQWLLISGIFMGGNVPERFAPGKFDLIGYGHQLFHLCINMVAWNVCEAASLDCAPSEHYEVTSLSPRVVAVVSVLLFSLGMILATIRQLMKSAREKKYE